MRDIRVNITRTLNADSLGLSEDFKNRGLFTKESADEIADFLGSYYRKILLDHIRALKI